ncbi:hypothetical protein LTR97_000158 [Elasticomyces elasticus]|uniref:Uncharacterized protein n=1 Tax=Elasticomyces elasticus TaxID=574655 RepID=A0AAN7WIQ9_9PEZI|nr:hypothetical protein LTR97_000158 [Elasticomyces elasticus]
MQLRPSWCPDLALPNSMSLSYEASFTYGRPASSLAAALDSVYITTPRRKADRLALARALFTISKEEVLAFGAFIDRPERLAGHTEGYFASKPPTQLPELDDVICLLPGRQLGDNCINTMLTQLTEHDGEVAVGSFGDCEDVYRGKKSACEAVKRSLRFKPKAKMVLLPMNVVYTAQVEYRLYNSLMGSYSMLCDPKHDHLLKLIQLKPAELQNNGYDCGVLIIAVATSRYEKRDLTTELGLVVKEAKDWRRSILIKLANRMREAPLPQTSPHNPATTPPTTASPTRRNHPRPSPAKRKEAPANSAVADSRKVQIVEEDAGVPGLEDIKPLTRKKPLLRPELEDETEIQYLRRLTNLSGEERKTATIQRAAVRKRQRKAADPRVMQAEREKQKAQKVKYDQKKRAKAALEEDQLDGMRMQDRRWKSE